MAEDYARRVADALIDQLRQGTAPWQQPWEPGHQFLPYNPTTGNQYRGMNAMWLLAVGQENGYHDPRWMTYKQAQSVDAQVRKGEKGTAIQYWKWRDEEQVRGEDGRPVLNANGRPETRTVDYDRPRVFTAVVFNAAQIDGLAPAPAPTPAPEWERHARADAILTNSAAAIRHQRGDVACYQPAADRIILPEREQFPNAEGYYRVALHELGHWTGHESRLNRDLAHPFGSEGYAREELRAEIASLMVGGQLEIGHDAGQHAAYVENWIKVLQDDPREVFRAAADAERIATMVRGFERVQTVDHAVDQAPVVAATRGAEGPVPLGAAAEFAADDRIEAAYAAAMTAAFRNPDEARAAVAVVALRAPDPERVAATLRDAPESYGPLQEAPAAREDATRAAALSTAMFAPGRLFRNELRDAFEDPVAAHHALDAAVADVGLGQALAALRDTPTVYGALQRDPELAGRVDPFAAVPPAVPLDEAAARGAAHRAVWHGTRALTAAHAAEVGQPAPTVSVAATTSVPLDAALARDVERFADRTTARLATERPDLAVAPRDQLVDAAATEATRSYLNDGVQDRVSILTYRWLDVELEPEQEAAFAAQDRQWQAGDRAELDAALREDLDAYLTRVGDDLTTRDAPVARGSDGHQAAILESAARYVGVLADRVTGHVEQWLAHARAASDVAPEASPDRVRAPRPVAVEETRERAPHLTPNAEDEMSHQQGRRPARGEARPETRAEARSYLAVPYAEKGEAKALGARWDRDAKSWYAPAGVDPMPLARWLPDLAPASAVRDPRAEFADALQTAGLRLDGAPVMDGQLRRVPVEGDRAGERSGAYVGHLDGHPAGYVENFKTGHKSNWKSQQPVAEVSAADRARLAEEAAAHRAARAAARDQQAQAVATAVHAVWDAAQPATGEHAYLAAKGVQAYGVRVAQTPALHLGPWAPDAASQAKAAAGQDVQRWGGPGALLVPVRTADGQFAGAQAIDADGRKSFPRGGRLAGGFHLIGDLAAPGPLMVAEGYATAATLHEHTAAPVAVAFHAGNLEPVARALRAAHPDRQILVAADNDHRKTRELGPDGKPKKNVGLEEARAAAAAVDGAVLAPAFGPDDRGSDWNDLRQEKGPREFARQVGRGLAVAERRQLVAAARTEDAERQTASLAPEVADDRMQVARPERELVRAQREQGGREMVQTARRGPRHRGH